MEIKKLHVFFLTFILFCNVSNSIFCEDKMIPSVMKGYNSFERLDSFRDGNIFALLVLIDEGYYTKDGTQNVVFIPPGIREKSEGEYREKILKALQSMFSEDRVSDLEVSIFPEGINAKVNIDGRHEFKQYRNGRFVILPNGLRDRVYIPISADILSDTQSMIKNIISSSPDRTDTINVHNIMFDRTIQFVTEDLSYFRQQKIETIFLVIIIGLIFICAVFSIIMRIKGKKFYSQFI